MGSLHFASLTNMTARLLRFQWTFLILLRNDGSTSAETTTCDTSYIGSGKSCVSYNFMCDDQVSAASAIPTCFTGVEQSPVDLTVNPGTVQEQDPGQISFLGYNDQLGQTPMLRLKDFTVQLDFEETLAISSPTRSNIQPTVKRGEQKQKSKKKKKKEKKKKKKKT